MLCPKSKNLPDPSVSPTSAAETGKCRTILCRRTADSPSAWLFDCVGLLPPSTQFYGFDITPAHFPAARDIPANVQLRRRDILAPDLSDDLVGSFDVVHIRAFGSVIRDSDCAPVLQAVNRLLKPGGWLQWEESDSSAMVAVGGDSGAGAGTALLRVIEGGGRARGTTFE